MATEKFRDWKMQGVIKVKYSDNTGVMNVWTKNQQELLDQIVQIVDTFSAQDIKLTSRQLYYQLVSAGIIPNADAIYKRICKFLTDARYAGLVDWEAIEDRGRVPQKHSEWKSVNELISSAVSSYRLPRWKDQDYYVELYSEKQAMESVLKPVADKFHIYFGYNKGYSSASMMYDLAKRCEEQIRNGKKVVVLYLGDHDSSGLDMVRDVRERIEEFLLKSELNEGEIVIDGKPIPGSETIGEDGKPIEGTENYEDNTYVDEDNIEEYFQVVPLALNMTQIRQYNPPPNPAKITDPRAKWYIKEYGQMSWELDALRPDVLIKIAEDGIKKYLDSKKYLAWLKLEQEQSKALEEFGNKLAEKENDEEGDDL